MKYIFLTFCISFIASAVLYYIMLNLVGSTNDEQMILAATYIIIIQLCAVIGILYYITQQRRK